MKSQFTICCGIAAVGLFLGACSSSATDDSADDGTSGLDCDNGVLDAGENCDPGITSGEAGACPTTCAEDTDPCTTITLTGDSADCTAECTSSAVSTCTPGDSCCPDNCNNNDDADCAVECGNGAIETGEMCDGNCPLNCLGGSCESGTLTGMASDCTAACAFTDIIACTDGDGCCPGGCDNVSDDDCVGMIGDACTSDADCSDICLDEASFGVPGGYCSANCFTNPALCGAGAHCDIRADQGFCLDDCLDNSDCRAPSYECFNRDQDGSLECAALATGAGAVGDACSTVLDCAGGPRGECLSLAGAGTVGGYCTLFPCNETDGDTTNDCLPGTSHCGLVDPVTDQGACLKDCVNGGDCRPDGYDCYDFDKDAGTTNECFIAGTAASGGDIGDPCTDTSDCGNGPFAFCFQGWTGGYCMVICPDTDGAACPAGSQCHDFGGFSRCLDICTAPGDCAAAGATCVDPDSTGNLMCFGN